MVTAREEFFVYGRSSDRRDTRNRYRFIGVERDEDTGLCSTGPRSYDPVSGRFLQGDPVVGGAAYVYSRGNPISRFDDNGYADEPAGVLMQGANGLETTEQFGALADQLITESRTAQAEFGVGLFSNSDLGAEYVPSDLVGGAPGEWKLEPGQVEQLQSALAEKYGGSAADWRLTGTIHTHAGSQPSKAPIIEGDKISVSTSESSVSTPSWTGSPSVGDIQDLATKPEGFVMGTIASRGRFGGPSTSASIVQKQWAGTVAPAKDVLQRAAGVSIKQTSLPSHHMSQRALDVAAGDAGAYTYTQLRLLRTTQGVRVEAR